MATSLIRIGTLGGLLLTPGCVAYRAEPIDPANSEQRFAARTLDDAGLAAWASSEVAAQAPPPSETWPPASWDLASLSLAAFWFHSDLDVARARAAAARAGVATASARPNPTLAFRSEYVLDPLPGDSRWVADLGLDIPIETAGKRGLATARAEDLALAAEIAVYEAAWSVRSRVRAALLEHLLARRDLDLVRAEAGLRGEAIEILRQRLSAGEAGRPEVVQAEIESARIDVESRTAEGRVDESRAALAEAIGLPAAALEGVSLEWPDLEHPPEDPAVEAARAAGHLNRFDVRRTLLEYDAAEADVRLEVARQYPDVSLAPGLIYDQGLHKLAFGFSLPLPLWNRNRGPIAEAEGRRSEAQARFLALQARAAGEIERGSARYRGALAGLLEARALADRQREREQAIGRAFQAGFEDRAALLGARIESAALDRSVLSALRGAREALGELEDSLQRPLEGVERAPDRIPEKPERMPKMPERKREMPERKREMPERKREMIER